MTNTLDSLTTDIKYLRKSHDEFRAEAKSELKEIRLQTQKTNGRMTKAEQDIVDIKQYHQEQQLKEDKTNDRFTAPIVTGVVVGLVLMLSQFLVSYFR